MSLWFITQMPRAIIRRRLTVRANNRNTRLHGQMKTNREGRYEFRTIKRRHIRVIPIPHTSMLTYLALAIRIWIDSYLFEGDPFITEDMRPKLSVKGNLSPILKLTRGTMVSGEACETSSSSAARKIAQANK